MTFKKRGPAFKSATQAWVGPWQAGDWQADPRFMPELVKWLGGQPLWVVGRLMLDFPPGCLVRAKAGVRLEHLPPGRVGIAVSYNGPDLGRATIGVVKDPAGEHRFYAGPDELEVVGYRNGFDREAMGRFVVFDGG